MKNLLSIFFILSCTLNVLANLASPSQGGHTLSEPKGIKNIDIIKEDLTIDFTKLADENTVWHERTIDVEAIYEVNNPTDISKLELVFVIVSESKNFQFFLDDKEIKTESIDNKEFADKQSWNKPKNTPYENQELMYNPANFNLKSAKFTLDLPKDKHTLRAKYKAQPTVYSNIGLTKGWQFAYSLSPAKDWKSFGDLNINIKIPDGWKFFSNLTLEKNNDSLTGKFSEIPADFLSVTTQMPRPENYNTATDITFFSFLGILLVFPILLIILAFWKGYKWNNSWAYGFLFGFLWAVLAGGSGYFSQAYPKSLIPAGQYASYGYGGLFETFMLVIIIPIVFIIGTVLWLAIVLIKAKKGKQI